MNEYVAIAMLVVICAIGTFILYGCWKWEHDRYNHRETYKIDPKYHGWEVNDEDKDQ